MAKLLKQIESELVKKYGGDAKSVGDILLNKSPEGISGSRLVSPTATFSMHMFGLAVDVNYLGNPYIQSKNIKMLNHVLRNAALLMNRPILSYQKGYAKNKFDSVQQLDSMLETYFSLLDKPAELAQSVQASTSSEWRGQSAVEARKKIQENLDNLAKDLVRVNPPPVRRILPRNTLLLIRRIISRNTLFWISTSDSLRRWKIGGYTGVAITAI